MSKKEELLKLKASLIALAMLLPTGCGKKSDCDITKAHLHKYINNTTGITTYIESEDLEENLSFGSNGKFNWTEEYKEADISELEKYRKLNNKNIYKIEDNRDLIKKIEQEKYFLYEFSYTTVEVNQTKNGYDTEEITKYDWTTDEKHENLTGRIRLIYPRFYAYKLKKGKLISTLEPSEYVRSLEEVEEEYPYIGPDFYDYFCIEYTPTKDGKYEVTEDDFYEVVKQKK